MKSHGDRVIEVIAVMLLGIATVGSALCGYQATRWNGEQARLIRVAADEHVESSRLFSLGTQTDAYDTNIVAQYAQAASAKDEKLMRFYRSSLVRPKFLPILDRWEAEVSSGVLPLNLLDDQEYLDTQFGQYRKVEADATANTLLADEAGRNADAFVLTTLLLAVGLFFAGVTASFRVRVARLMLLGGAALTLSLAAARLVDLPFK